MCTIQKDEVFSIAGWEFGKDEFGVPYCKAKKTEKRLTFSGGEVINWDGSNVTIFLEGGGIIYIKNPVVSALQRLEWLLERKIV